MILHMISHVYEIIGVDYDIRCNFVYFLAPAHADSNAGRGPLKSGPEPVQMHPGSNQMQQLLDCASPLRLSVLFGFHFWLPNQVAVVY